MGAYEDNLAAAARAGQSPDQYAVSTGGGVLIDRIRAAADNRGVQLSNADLTRISSELQNGRSFDNLRNSLSLRASNQPATPAAGTTPTTTPPVVAPAENNTADAYQSLLGMLSQWDLGSLGPKLLGFLKEGYAADAIQYLLSQEPEYKQRFAANDTRVKNGLAPLNPAEYLNSERAYRSVLQASGLPSGFYDSRDDFTKFLGMDVSPSEVKARADDAVRFADNTDPTAREQLQQFYGVDRAHLAAYFLDPEKAQPLLDRQAKAAETAAAAVRNGLTVDRTRAEYLADSGVTDSQARTGYGQIGQFLPAATSIGERFNNPYSQTDAENEIFGGLASAARKRKQLSGQEQGLFQSSTGNSRDALSRDRGGSF